MATDSWFLAWLSATIICSYMTKAEHISVAMSGPKQINRFILYRFNSEAKKEKEGIIPLWHDYRWVFLLLRRKINSPPVGERCCTHMTADMRMRALVMVKPCPDYSPQDRTFQLPCFLETLEPLISPPIFPKRLHSAEG